MSLTVQRRPRSHTSPTLTRPLTPLFVLSSIPLTPSSFPMFIATSSSPPIPSIVFVAYFSSSKRPASPIPSSFPPSSSANSITTLPQLSFPLPVSSEVNNDHYFAAGGIFKSSIPWKLRGHHTLPRHSSTNWNILHLHKNSMRERKGLWKLLHFLDSCVCFCQRVQPRQARKRITLFATQDDSNNK